MRLRNDFILYVALLLYSGIFWYVAKGVEMYSRDGYVYCQFIDLWAKQGGEVAYQGMKASSLGESVPPLAIAMPAVAVQCGTGVAAALLWYNYLTGIFFVIGGWLCGVALFRVREAVALTALSCAVYPGFIQVNADLLRDGSYLSFLFLAVGCLLIGLQGARRYGWWCAGAGLAATAALFTRREGLEFVFCVMFWLFWEALAALRRRFRPGTPCAREQADFRKTVNAGLIFLCTYIVGVGAGWFLLSFYPSCRWRPVPFDKVLYIVRSWGMF